MKEIYVLCRCCKGSKKNRYDEECSFCKGTGYEWISKESAEEELLKEEIESRRRKK